WLQQETGLDDREFFRTFNAGIGMVLIVDAGAAAAITSTLQAHGQTVYEIGKITPAKEQKQRVEIL
ncbi:MAG: AIR synthase-related protein, partial [Saezia sp.]